MRLIGAQGEQMGTVPTREALRKAEEASLDLVEVSATSRPPVCRIMDYSKYRYDQEKKEREARRHQKLFTIKEIRVRPNIEEHDYLVKIKHAQEFLHKGHKVKVTLLYRGREITHKEIGNKLIERLIKDVAGFGTLEKQPMAQGKMVFLTIIPTQHVNVQNTTT